MGQNGKDRKHVRHEAEGIKETSPKLSSIISLKRHAKIG